MKAEPDFDAETIRDFVRDPVRAVPRRMALRLGKCTFVLTARLEAPDRSSDWTQSEDGCEVRIATADVEPHDLGMELLLSLGQLLWETATDDGRVVWLKLLKSEIDAGVAGEIDEDALEEKTALLTDRKRAGDVDALERYAAASFASTAAEYVHSMWHDVTVRTGPGHIDAGALRRRLELFARWFPPNRGYRLFP